MVKGSIVQGARELFAFTWKWMLWEDNSAVGCSMDREHLRGPHNTRTVTDEKLLLYNFGSIYLRSFLMLREWW